MTTEEHFMWDYWLRLRITENSVGRTSQLRRTSQTYVHQQLEDVESMLTQEVIDEFERSYSGLVSLHN